MKEKWLSKKNLFIDQCDLKATFEFIENYIIENLKVKFVKYVTIYKGAKLLC